MENEHELGYETLTRVYLGSYEHYKGVGAEVEYPEPGFDYSLETGSLRIHIEQRIAAMMGYRGGSGGCFEMKSLELIVISNSSDDSNGPSIPRVPVYGPSVQGLLDYYDYDNIEDYLSDFYFPSTNKEDTVVHTEFWDEDTWKMCKQVDECLDDSKGVSSKGQSITSILKEGPSIARLSKEPIPKELLAWYGYDIVEDLPVAKKPILKVIFKSHTPILSIAEWKKDGGSMLMLHVGQSNLY
ncbi:hypothetical protein Tco_0841554 [Tanacetum coccineum]|uniref:Uncharacterized protein n=1 Tax=Tanacetum coccineum TaxID=301880 RepID=A0ABQ5B066_9ASTR